MLRVQDAYLFAEPVDRGIYPEYYEVIDKPMDLGTVMERLQGGDYGPIAQSVSFLSLPPSLSLVPSHRCRTANVQELQLLVLATEAYRSSKHDGT